MSEAFLRAEMLLGPEAMSVLSGAHVAVLGLGGVGSWCAEALARTGVGALTLADHDTVGLSNLNRQAEALHSTLDQPKAQAMGRPGAGHQPRVPGYPPLLPLFRREPGGIFRRAV